MGAKISSVMRRCVGVAHCTSVGRMNQPSLRSAVPPAITVASGPLASSRYFEAFASDGMDRTTIYRNLVDLTEVGLVSRTDLGDHVWRFELKRGNGNGDDARHPHFTCSDCGAVSCLPEVTLKVKQGKGVPRALTQQKVEIQLRGQCDACAA